MTWRDLRSSRGPRDWLHDAFRHVLTNLEPHVRPATGRETVMEAAPDACISSLLSKRRDVGPAVRDTWGRRACHGDLRNLIGSERRLDDTGDGAALDAMRARVFRVHRRVGDRLPGCVTISGRIAIDIAIANGCDRSPKIVVVL